MNTIVLLGRVGSEIEMRQTNSGTTVARFSLAVDRKRKNAEGEKVTDWFKCNLYGRQAEIANEYLEKGGLAGVSGRLEIDEVVQQDGSKQKYINVQVDTLNLIPGQKSSGGGHGGGYSNGKASNSGAGQYKPKPKQQQQQLDDEGW